MRTSKSGLVSGISLAAALTGSVALTASPADAAGSKGAVVVQTVNRSPIGNMLATTAGASLYYLPSGSCTGSCLTIWPRLLMPAGKTKPKGVECLSTMTTSAGLQVTYHNAALYTFTGDTGSSVNGNGVAGFKAAKITKMCP